MGKLARPRVVAMQHLAELDLPQQITLSLAELARSAKEHALSLFVALGLRTLAEIFEHEIAESVGPKGMHDPGRTAYRHGSEEGSVTLGGRLVPVRRPRARRRDGSGELPLRTDAAPWPTASCSARPLWPRCSRASRPATTRPASSRSARRSRPKPSAPAAVAVSRRFVAGTADTLGALRAHDLSRLGLLAVFIDGIQIGGQAIVVALGVDRKGEKHVLDLQEGSTENAAVCRSLLGHLVERGLPADRALLLVTAGGKGIAKAIRDSCGALALQQRCQLHKRRNAVDHLPEGLRPLVGLKLDQAWRKDDPDAAERALRALADSLEEAHPGAADSIREGLGETLTIKRLGLSPALVRTFKSTNPIESVNDGIRTLQRNVKHWRSGKMAERWTAAATLERERRFRRINGHRDLWLLERARSTGTPRR